MLYLLCFCYILINRISSPEVITLMKGRNVTCVLSQNAISSGLYIAHDFQKTKKEEFKHGVIDIINSEDLSEDWNQTYANNSLHGPVIDERWTSFRWDNILVLTDTVNCFSIYANTRNNKLVISVQPESFGAMKNFNLITQRAYCGGKQFCYSWIHFTAIRKHRSLELTWGENKNQTLTMDFIPHAITMDDDASMLKVHEYTFQTSTKISSGNLRRYTLHLKGSSCIQMFVSVDKNCTLNITLESDSRNFTKTHLVNNINSNTNNGLLKEWQKVRIETEFLGEVNLSFSRIRNDDETRGYWAVDAIQLCSMGVEIYSTELISNSSDAYLCKALNTKTRTSNQSTPCNKTGYLGSNCNISCSQVLGKSNSYCENHKICTQDSRCSCAWGYRKSFCTEKCKEGHWGMNCEATCDSKCNNCDYKEGCIPCNKTHFGVKCSKKLPIPLKGPEFKSITENLITITLENINHGHNEVKPEFYQIQYKKVNETKYKNYSDPILYPPKNKTYTIQDLLTKTYSYQIRVILIVENQSYTEDIPELTLEVPEAPQSFIIKPSPKTNSSIVLNWAYPVSINIPLKRFEITVKKNNARIKKYNYPVRGDLREYEYPVSVDYMQEYVISVYGVNHVEGKKATFKVTMIRSTVENSSVRLLETCSKTCQLIVPKLRVLKSLEILVVKKSSSRTKNLSEIYDSIKKEGGTKEGWIIEPFATSSENLKFEITEIVNDVVSIKNPTYIMYLSLYNNFKKKHRFYPIEEKAEVVKAEIYDFFFLILFVHFCLSTLVLITIYYYKQKQPTFATKNLKESTENEVLLTNIYIPQSIDTRNFEKELKNALTNKGLARQFQSISETSKQSSILALQSKNNNKNRDRYNIPYDWSRVVLKKMNGLGSDDYINASYIDGYDRPKAYIASQGPKFSTTKDFWRMIWQEEIETVVMATNFIENQNRMCAEYWPQRLDSIFECGEMSIKLIKEELHEHYDSRVLEMYYTSDTRQLLHLHLKWNSDDYYPVYPNFVVPVVKRIRQACERNNKPVVIHSAFGANRTGALILCDLALQMAKSENKIDFYTLTKKLREQRPNMVNNLKRYILAHLVILESIMEAEHPFKQSIEENMHSNVINQQFQYLERLWWLDSIVQSWIPQPRTINNCFNPVLVDGYGKSGKYLVMKLPTRNTVVEFWTMIAVESIRCILFLNEVKRKDHVPLWPSRNVTSEIIINVRERKVTVAPHCTITELLLLAHEKSSGMVINQNIIFVFELHDWKPKQLVPHSSNNILKIIRDINKVSENQTHVLVACANGFSASGLFAALSYCVEKYKKELEIDVCNALRTVRRSGTQFVNSYKQLKFIYTCILDYLQNFESYERIVE